MSEDRYETFGEHWVLVHDDLVQISSAAQKISEDLEYTRANYNKYDKDLKSFLNDLRIKIRRLEYAVLSKPDDFLQGYRARHG